MQYKNYIPQLFVTSKHQKGKTTFRQALFGLPRIKVVSPMFLQAILSPSSSQLMHASVSRPSPEATRAAERADFMEFLHFELRAREKAETNTKRNRRQERLNYF
jgi:hypothetical protein